MMNRLMEKNYSEVFGGSHEVSCGLSTYPRAEKFLPPHIFFCLQNVTFRPCELVCSNIGPTGRSNELSGEPRRYGRTPPTLQALVNAEESRPAVEVLFDPDQVDKLRVFKVKITASDYSDDHGAFAEEAVRLDCKGYQKGYRVYGTLNEIDPALLARGPPLRGPQLQA